MKKLTISLFFMGIFFLSIARIAPDTASKGDCDIKPLKKEGIAELNPFYYSSAITTSIDYRDTAHFKEIIVPLFKGEKYRMVFNGKSLPAGVEINIYDRDKNSTSREAVFSSSSASEKLIVFEPEKAKKYYVSYRIPAGGKIQDACMVFVLGYQLTFVK